MFKPKPANLVAILFAAALAIDTATVPRLISKAKAIESNHELEVFIQDVRDENRHVLSSISTYNGGNMHFHGSVTIGFSVEALLGKHDFTRVYNKKNGVTYKTYAYFIPNLFRIFLAGLIGSALYFGVSRVYPGRAPAD